MRSGDLAERKYQRHQGGAGSHCIGEERQSHIATGQALSHHARTDYRGDEEGAPKEFRYSPAREGHFHLLPMWSISFLIASLSRLANGRDTKRAILRSSIRNASRNAFSICPSLPSTAAGSGTPQ